MLESAYKPEYPCNTVDRALAFHLNYLLTTPATILAESQDESDERLFVLRPFVFAAHRVSRPDESCYHYEHLTFWLLLHLVRSLLCTVGCKTFTHSWRSSHTRAG
jgi:hypothetical protein